MNELKILIISMAIFILISMVLKSREKNLNIYNGFDIGCDCLIGNRELQEDSSEIVFSKDKIMAVIADGRGKNKAGKISSLMASAIFSKLFKQEDSLQNINYFYKKAFNITNREILKKFDDGKGGASIVAAIIKDGMLHYALVGNAKICVFRNQELIALSEGHTVNIIAEQGFYQGKISKEKALGALKQKRLLNYVGQDGFKEVEIYDAPITLKLDDIIVLMSDGVHNYLPWSNIEKVLKKKISSQEIAQDIIDKLYETKIENKDNASIIVMKYKVDKLRV